VRPLVLLVGYIDSGNRLRRYSMAAVRASPCELNGSSLIEGAPPYHCVGVWNLQPKANRPFAVPMEISVL
jgi:hypothetical protein